MKFKTLIKIYDQLNEKNFGGVLSRPVIRFNRTKNIDGFWCEGKMGFNLSDTKGFFKVTELVYHEMVHQYIDEFLKLELQDDHGKEFKKCYRKFHTHDFLFDKGLNHV